MLCLSTLKSFFTKSRYSKRTSSYLSFCISRKSISSDSFSWKCSNFFCFTSYDESYDISTTMGGDPNPSLFFLVTPGFMDFFICYTENDSLELASASIIFLTCCSIFHSISACNISYSFYFFSKSSFAEIFLFFILNVYTLFIPKFFS